MSNNLRIGSIVSVSGSTISVHLNKDIQSNIISYEGETYRIGQIGTLLSINMGYTTLIALITRTGVSAIPIEDIDEKVDLEKILDENRWVEAVLVGEIHEGTFDRGVGQYPIAGDGVYLVSNNLLRCIYSQTKDMYPIDIGTINESSGLRANLDMNKLISRHCAILGSTGSGKSNAVSIVLNHIAEKQELIGSRILVIDPHGEYSVSFKNKANIFKISPQPSEEASSLYIPFWALDLDSLLNIIGIQLEQRSYDALSSRINDAKEIALDSMGINKLTVNFNAPIPYNIYKVWFDIDENENFTCNDRNNPKTSMTYSERGDWQSLKKSKFIPPATGNSPPFLGNSTQGLRRFADSLWLKMKDPKYKFIFDPSEYKPSGEAGVPNKELFNLIYSWFAGDKKITILDLSDVPIDIVPIVTGSILSFVYDSLRIKGQVASGKASPILFVLEEAHIYLSKEKTNLATSIIKRISKEGRKYGAGLLLVSQRAGEIDETVLSQCGTIIALRMNNSHDRSAVSSAMQDDLKSITELLPILRTGECIVSGEATVIPLRIKFDFARFAKSGSDPKVSMCWKNGKPSESDYQTLIKTWRREGEV